MAAAASMKKKYKIQKAASGLQSIQAKNSGMRSLISGGLAAGADALLPGAGTAVNVLEGISSSLKDENGLYKSKVGQVLDNLNPVTAISTSLNAVGGIFSGKAFRGGFDPSGQSELRDALRKQKIATQQKNTWANVTSDVASDSQLGQYKNGASKVATKPIEIEGGEPHFSKPVGGKRALKMYSPTGPSHEEGGIPVLAEQGDAIVTKKGNLGKQAVLAHQQGNHELVERIIDKMPADKGSSKARGGKRRVKAADSTLPKITYTPPSNVLPVGLFDNPSTTEARARQIGQPFREPDVSMDIYNKNKTAYLPAAPTAASPAATGVASKATGLLNNLATAAPSIYNLGQGLFGDVAKTTRRNFNPTALTYEDGSNPTRQAITQGVRASISNARNISGGNAGNIRANANQAYATGISQLASVNNQESQRKLDVNNTNVGIKNDAQLRNNAMNDQADQLDLMNSAKKQEALAKGLEGISGLSQNSQLMANQQAASEASANSIGQMYRNFELVDGKWVVKKARKGIKKVK